MTPKDPFLEGTFWDKFWRPIRSRALLFTPECLRCPSRTPEIARFPRQDKAMLHCDFRGERLSGPEMVPPKNSCDKDFAELSGELSGAICLTTLVIMGTTLELVRKFFGAVRAIFLALGFLLAL